MKNVGSKDLEKEEWVSFELFNDEIFLSEKQIDELALDTYKWGLKFNVQKLKNNSAFMGRVKAAIKVINEF